MFAKDDTRALKKFLILFFAWALSTTFGIGKRHKTGKKAQTISITRAQLQVTVFYEKWTITTILNIISSNIFYLNVTYWLNVSSSKWGFNISWYCCLQWATVYYCGRFGFKWWWHSFKSNLSLYSLYYAEACNEFGGPSPLDQLAGLWHKRTSGWIVDGQNVRIILCIFGSYICKTRELLDFDRLGAFDFDKMIFVVARALMICWLVEKPKTPKT